MAKKAARKIMRTSPTGSRGFTLIEIIVVVVLISILATMTVLSMYSGASPAKLRGSAQRLLVAARFARDFATTHRCKSRLMIDPDKQQYAITFQPDPQHDPSKFVPLATTLGKVQSLSQGIRFVNLRIVPRQGRDQLDPPRRETNYITFEPTGSADAAVLEVTNGKQSYSVLIVPHTGYAKLIEGTLRELPNDRLDLDI